MIVIFPFAFSNRALSSCAARSASSGSIRRSTRARSLSSVNRSTYFSKPMRSERERIASGPVPGSSSR